MVRLNKNKLLGFRLEASSKPALQAKIGDNGGKAPAEGKPVAAGAKIGGSKRPS